ncbi:MAG: DUF4248 domain-containing protein [Mediterranea massiliensis]|nr:DUF4248 domain-containing protein [Mediterranea massiliensis]
MELKSYTKSELGLLYAPHLDQPGAVSRLMRWIKRCAPLYEALQDSGYEPQQKRFTLKQVELIFTYLGEP